MGARRARLGVDGAGAVLARLLPLRAVRHERGGARRYRLKGEARNAVEQSLADAEHPKYLLEWLLKKTGPLTSTVAEAFAFCEARVRAHRPVAAGRLQFHRSHQCRTGRVPQCKSV